MLAFLRTLWFRFRQFLSNGRSEEEFHRELQEHLTLLTEENIRRGMPPLEAARQAHLRFGGVTQFKEHRREHGGVQFLETAFQDLRYAARTLMKSPGFSAVAVLTLALGIGLNTTVFTLFDAVALKPLPVDDPNSVVRVARLFTSGAKGDEYRFSYPEYLYYRQQSRSFSALIATTGPVSVLAETRLAGAAGPLSEPEQVQGRLVSENYFSGLRVGTVVGRAFLPDENRIPGARPVLVLSHQYWRRRYQSNPEIVGQVLQLNGVAFTIVGVAAREFIGAGNPPQIPDFWAPLMMDAQLVPGALRLEQPHADNIELLGRLLPGFGHRQSEAGLAVLAHQFEARYPLPDPTRGMRLEPATFFGQTSDIRFRLLVTILMLLMGSVLLIACANLANMLLARAAGRQREIGLRLALGAGRGRLVRQLLTESLLLSLLGGAAGLLISIWTSRLLWVALAHTVEAFLNTRSSLVISLTPDLRVFAYTFALSVVTGVVFGLVPALQSCRADLLVALKDEGALAGSRLVKSQFRNILLAGQVAGAMLLLITAGLLTKGLLRSQSVNVGFETRKVFLVQIRSAKQDRIFVERLKTLSQIKQVATVGGNLPLEGTWTWPVVAEAASAANAPSTTLVGKVSGSYFETLGIPIVAGRPFTRTEGEKSAPVAVISASGARQFWPGENPIGKRFKLAMDRSGGWARFEVIGIAGDVRNGQLSRVDPSFVYLPWESGRILIRTADDSENALRAVRATLQSLDPTVPASLSFTSLENGPVRLQRLLTSTYAICALVLACLAVTLAGIGIYGLMSYLVSRRTRDIGIHVVMGARPADVLAAMAVEGMRPVLAGAALGMAGSLGVTGILKAMIVAPSGPDMLFGGNAFDPATFIGLTGLMAAVALIASLVPAWRAMRVDPIVALRCE